MWLGSAFTGRTNEPHRKARLERHRDECRLAVTRNSLDADLPGVHCGIRFEIIQSARRTPSPGAQRTPIVRLARLALVAQADDALGQPRAIVRLNTVRNNRGVTPARRNQLLRGR